MFRLYFQLNFVVTRNNFPDTKRQLVFHASDLDLHELTKYIITNVKQIE